MSCSVPFRMEAVERWLMAREESVCTAASNWNCRKAAATAKNVNDYGVCRERDSNPHFLTERGF